MKTAICLNCHEISEKNYCSNCGQKTDTHRINFKHFVIHDILHGVWHMEKGILFTIKEALTRPGNAALDYINGKRIKYYNVFYLTVLLVGLQIFLANYYGQLQTIYYPELVVTSGEASQKSVAFLSDYSKILILSLIPFFAINSFIIFRRKKLNLSEHFIISGMIFLGVMLITLVSTMISFIDFLENLSTIATIFDRSTPIILLLYINYGYYKAFQSSYSTSKLILKIIAFDIMLVLEIFLFLTFLYFIFNKIV